MNGLVWKDMVMMRSGIMYISVFAVVFCLLFRENNVMSIVCSMLFASLASSSFAWDDQCQWNVFAVAAGVDRKAIVRSKFVSSILFVLIGTAIGFVVSVALAAYQGEIDVANLCSVSLIGFVLGAIVSGISIGVNYVTGSSVKAQYVSIIVLMVSIMVLVASTIIATDMLGGDMAMVLALLVVMMFVVLALTYKVSCAKFLRRDL